MRGAEESWLARQVRWAAQDCRMRELLHRLMRLPEPDRDVAEWFLGQLVEKLETNADADRGEHGENSGDGSLPVASVLHADGQGSGGGGGVELRAGDPAGEGSQRPGGR